MSPLAAAAPYIGAPYRLHGRTPEGWDCWGCVRYLRAEIFARHSPSWAEAYAPEDGLVASTLALVTERLVRERLAAWRPVEPKEGAVVLILIFGRIAHVGLMLDRQTFVHAMAGSGTALALITEPRWRNRIGGYYDA